MVAGVLQAGAGAYCMNCDKADIEYEYYALVVVTSDIAIAIAARGAMSRRSATNATTNNQGGRNPSRMGGATRIAFASGVTKPRTGSSTNCEICPQSGSYDSIDDYFLVEQPSMEKRNKRGSYAYVHGSLNVIRRLLIFVLLPIIMYNTFRIWYCQRLTEGLPARQRLVCGVR